MAVEQPEVDAIIAEIRRALPVLFPDRHEEIARWFELLIDEKGTKKLAEELTKTRERLEAEKVKSERLAASNSGLIHEAERRRKEERAIDVGLLDYDDDYGIDPADIPPKR